jgi:hypothetical protein
MTIRSRPARAGAGLGLILAASTVAAACGIGSNSARPTDPREILDDAIPATATLPTARIHAQLDANVGGQFGANQNATITLDLDVNLETRELAGRAVTQMPANLGGGGPNQHTSEMIVTQTATFSRNDGIGHWTKFSSNGLQGGPTNEQIAQLIANLLSNPAVELELADASACSLGTCDHVIVHVNGQGIAAALGPMLGMPIDASTRTQIPNFDIDVLVDQATSVVSELRTEAGIQGTSGRLQLVLSNPGVPFKIALPAADQIDDVDFGGGLGGGTVIGTVGGEVPAGSADPGVQLEPQPSVP